MSEFRFNPYKVRKAGLPSVPYAKALVAIWSQRRPVTEMRKAFGPKVLIYLERGGHIRRDGNAYILTLDGLKTLTLCGYPPVPEVSHEPSKPTTA